jgi:hypothetical protein
MKKATRHLRKNRVTKPNDVLEGKSIPQPHAQVGELEASAPIDEQLLERTRTQWQFGDWASLVQLDPKAFQNHPERAKLALLLAAGHHALAHKSEARTWMHQSLEWGCNRKLVSQLLLSGVHNTLGRAAALAAMVPGNLSAMKAQQTQCAVRHFQTAVTIGAAGTDVNLITHARLGGQLAQMGLPKLHSSFSIGGHSSSSAVLDGQLIGWEKPEAVSAIGLGNAWAGNTVNTVIFRHHGILTQGIYQFTAFYVDKNILRLVQRDLATNAIQACDLVGEYNLNDAHNTISLGLDRAGYLHMCYDHHGTQLRYRRSTETLNIQGWTDELQMTGQHEGKVTYPCFVQPHHECSDRPLLLLYRDGAWNKGSARLKTYDEATQTWEDRPIPILSGTDQKPWTSNAYWNHPAVGADGSLHLSFVWRTDSLGHEQRINNINVCYAKSMDWGLNWVTSLGQPYRLPITQVNAETVHPASPGSNLINQCSMALDSLHRPHVVFYSNDKNSIPQYQHLWFDGKEWCHQFIANRTQAFSLQGGGTLQIPISRPEIVIDRQDNVYIVYRGDLSNNRIVATLLPVPDYCFDPANTQILWDEDLGYSEPVIDRIRWERDNILSLLLQHNQQPNYDIGHEQINRPVTLVDINFH